MMERGWRKGTGAILVGFAVVTVWAAPGRPKMESPLPGDCPARRPLFSWTIADQASAYLLSITRNGEPWLEKWTRQNRWAPRFDFPEGVYEARVIAWDGAEYGQWSARVKFRRVFAPALAGINGIREDGEEIILAAGEGIEIETLHDENTLVIHAMPVTVTQLVNQSVITEKIANEAVTVEKLASDSVSTVKLVDGAVTTEKLANGAVTAVKLGVGAVSAGALASNAVGTAALADGSVTREKLAAGAVHPADMASSGASEGQVLKWSGVAWVPASIPSFDGLAVGKISFPPEAPGDGSIVFGDNNSCLGNYGVIIGGHNNNVGINVAYGTILGGQHNWLAPFISNSVIIGGQQNIASKDYCLAAGRQAAATNTGAFVWADASGVNAGSWGSNTVLFRASGGVRFESATPGAANHRVEWKPGDAAWQFSSDRALKEKLELVQADVVLEKVAALPVYEWNFRGSERRHIGVMAQDFHALFPLEGAEETLLDSADLHGVTIAAIRALREALEAERARADRLEKRVKQLERWLCAP